MASTQHCYKEVAAQFRPEEAALNDQLCLLMQVRMRAAAHPRSPLCARGTLPGVLDGQVGSASFPTHKRRRCRPALRRPDLLNRRIVAPPRQCSASPSLTCHTVAASRAWEGRSRVCTQHGNVLDICAKWLQDPGVGPDGSAVLPERLLP